MSPDPLASSAFGQSLTGPEANTSSRYTPLDPLRILRENIRLLIVTGFAGIVLGILTWGLCLMFTPIYGAEAMLQASMGLDDPMNPAVDTNRSRVAAEVLDRFIKGQTTRITTDNILNDVLAATVVRETDWFKQFSDSPDALEGLGNDLSVFPLRDSDMLVIRMSSTYKNDLRIVIDEVVRVYRKRISDDQQRITRDVNRTFRNERDDARQEMEQIELALQQFLDENDITVMNSRDSEATIKFARATENIIALSEELEGQKTSYQQIIQSQMQGQVEATPEAIYAIEEDRSIRALSDQLVGLRTRRDALLQQGYGEKHTSVFSIDSQIESTLQQKKIEIDRRLRQRQDAQVDAMENGIERLQAQLDIMLVAAEEATTELQDLTQKLESYDNLKQEYERAFERYRTFEKQLTLLGLGEQRADAVRVKVMHLATEPKLSFPKPQMVVPGVAILIIGMVTGLLFLKELMDQRIKSPADMRMIQSCSLLGVLPAATEDPSGPARIEGVVQKDPTGLMAESFRKVRTELLAKIDKHGHKIVLFVGAQPGSGTSAVTSNLATSIAYNGRSVLVIDANIRRPGQHKLHGVAAAPGLVDVLANNTTLDQAMIHLDNPKIDLLPVGTTAHAHPELLESKIFTELLNNLRNQYDVILIDSPPGLLASDSLLISKRVDAVAFVVRALNDQRGMLNRLVKQFDGGNAENLGVIINGIRSSAGGYFQKNYEEFYRYRQAAAAENNEKITTDA